MGKMEENDLKLKIRESRKMKPPVKAVPLMYRVYKYVLPGVRSELAIWRRHAAKIPDPELRKQALESMTAKQFHCEGGGVYAVLQLDKTEKLIPLIVALQTISDYLDNLCDRSTSLDPDDFRLLHQSMLDAVNPDATLQNYYALRKEQDDGGYLNELVTTCQQQIRKLPSYSVVQECVEELVSYYCDLQVYKHIRNDLREEALISWWEMHKSRFSDLSWNEFAAATGSTLGMFMLFTLSAEEGVSVEEARSTQNLYFPYICGLHIMLDYLIDEEEDRLGGDLNFCSYYGSEEEKSERMLYIVEKAREDAAMLPHPGFHSMIVEGLLALYLSDPKVRSQEEVKRVSQVLMKRSPAKRLFFFLNTKWIRRSHPE